MLNLMVPESWSLRYVSRRNKMYSKTDDGSGYRLHATPK